jgi:hypothetical protein
MNLYVTIALLVVLLADSRGDEASERIEISADDGGIQMAHIVTPLPDTGNFVTYRESDFALLPANDRRLQAVYVEFLSRCPGSDITKWRMQPHLVAAYHDMVRRGDELTPYILTLMRENPNSQIEIGFLLLAAWLPGIDIEPYLDYSREIFASRWARIGPPLAHAGTRILVFHGDDSDVELLRKFATKRPLFSSVVETYFTGKYRLQTQRLDKDAESGRQNAP